MFHFSFKVLLATFIAFMVAGIWYTPIFGKFWGKIHGMPEKPTEAQKKQMQKEMLPLMIAQFLLTFLMFSVFCKLKALSGIDTYKLAVMCWLGFLVPADVSSILFGGTKKEYRVAKIGIAMGGSLLPLLAGAWVMTR
jgi:uncharacterized membrane protein